MIAADAPPAVSPSAMWATVPAPPDAITGTFTASATARVTSRSYPDAVNVPVIASGGAGTIEHIAEGLTAGGAQAAIISSILYSPRLDRNVGVRELKAGLAERAVPMRPYLD